MEQAEFLNIDGETIALRYRAGGKSPGLIWLGGYGSDMMGTKACYLDDSAAKWGIACLRHDYSGHGESSGLFGEGTISRWLAQSLHVYETKAQGSQILIGSSMGGWIALRMAQELKKRAAAAPLAAIILLAPAPDFTATLIEPHLTETQKQQLASEGYFATETEYGVATYSRALIEDGRNNLVQTGLIETGCPVHIIHGGRDDVVPYQHSLNLLQYLPLENVTLTLVQDGDHRLSRSSDLALLGRIIEPYLAPSGSALA